MIEKEKNNNLNCPIRGKIPYSPEEKQRISLINEFLKKGYKKNKIILEKNLKIGSDGNKGLNIDVYYKDEFYEIACEVKRNDLSKIKISNAIENQLKPVINKLSIKWGIYYDGINNLIIDEKGNQTSFSLFPDYGDEFKVKNIKLQDLNNIKNISIFLDKIDDFFYSLVQRSKELRYKMLLELIIIKYYDEKFNYNNLVLNTSKSNFYYNFKKLKNNAIQYYNLDNILSSVSLTDDLTDAQIKEFYMFIQEFSFINSSFDFIQSFFMKFGSSLTKKDMSQYYTPITLVNFITSILDVKLNSKIIDPAGGTADFLVGILQNNRNNTEISKNLYYIDLDKEVSKLALFNMILNNDGRSNIETFDSIENLNYKNNFFDFVITNPPFGKAVKWKGSKNITENYELYDDSKGETGILFIERSINLLKNNGIMAIILPSGYLNNKTLKYIRSFLFKKGRLIADVSFPSGAFSIAGTGVKTDLLLFQKKEEFIKENYKIFLGSTKSIGFDYNKKTKDIIYSRDKNGFFLLNEFNEKIIDNGLNEIKNKLLFFSYENNIENIKQENNNLEYNFTTLEELDEYYSLKPELYEKKYLEIINNKDENFFSINELIEKGEKINILKRKVENFISPNKNYQYLSLKSIKLMILEKNILPGWELLTINRARNICNERDILIPYLLGSYKSFFFNDTNEKILCSTGFINVSIENEKILYSFLNFLFQKSYKIQFEALSTGHIQSNIDIEDIKKFKFKILNSEEVNKFKKELESFSIINQRMME